MGGNGGGSGWDVWKQSNMIGMTFIMQSELVPNLPLLAGTSWKPIALTGSGGGATK